MFTETDRCRELWFTGPRAVEVRSAAVPRPLDGQVLVRALASGISQGTELLLYRGEGATPFDPSLDLPHAVTYPRRYGYAWVGEVVGRGEGGGELSLGARVFALAAHGDFHALDAHAVRPLDARIPPNRAVLAASLETAVTCVWDCGASLGDIVVVIGGGVVGLLIARLAASVGGRVRLVERSPRRRAVARALGVTAVAPEEEDPCGDADVVVEATGDPAALSSALAHAAQEATVVVTSFYGARTAPVSLGGEFHRRRLIVRSSQVSCVPPARSPRWTLGRRFELVASLLTDPCLDALLDPPVEFGSAPATYARLDRSPGGAMQTVFVYA